MAAFKHSQGNTTSLNDALHTAEAEGGQAELGKENRGQQWGHCKAIPLNGSGNQRRWRICPWQTLALVAAEARAAAAAVATFPSESSCSALLFPGPPSLSLHTSRFSLFSSASFSSRQKWIQVSLTGPLGTNTVTITSHTGNVVGHARPLRVKKQHPILPSSTNVSSFILEF